jgi:putative endonuclease
MFYSYILKSKLNGAYYVGSCHDLEKRVDLHNHGMAKSTKRYAPWSLVYYETFEDLKDARQREKQIKLWKKRERIESLIKHFKN